MRTRPKRHRTRLPDADIGLRKIPDCAVAGRSRSKNGVASLAYVQAISLIGARRFPGFRRLGRALRETQHGLIARWVSQELDPTYGYDRDGRCSKSEAPAQERGALGNHLFEDPALDR